MRLIFCAALLAVTTPIIGAQIGAAEFEVASIKPNTSGAAGVNMRVTEDSIVMTNVPARGLIGRAFPTILTLSGVPSWADAERFDVVVKMPAGAPRDQLPLMWRTLLANRMKFAAHVETRAEPAYELVVAREGQLGPQLKPSKLDCSPEARAQRERPSAAGVRPTADEALARCSVTASGNTVYSGAITMAGLAGMLRSSAGRPVIDRTGLTGAFQLALTFSTNPANVTDDVPSLFTAMQEQLGLRLRPSQTDVDVEILVVDHLERPTEN